MTTTPQVTQDSDPLKGKAARPLSLLKQTMQPRLACHAALYPAGIATAALLGGAGESDAGVITTTGAPVTFTSFGSPVWDVDGDTVDDFFFSDGGRGPGAGLSSCMQITGAGSNALAYTGSDLLPINPADSVGPGNTFSNLDCNSLFEADCDWAGWRDFDSFPGVLRDTNSSDGTGYDISGQFGFRFDNGGTTNYGVANFSMENWDGVDDGIELDGTFTIHNWAYEDSGAPILGSALAAVPEASEAMVAMLGMTGLLWGSRRRRKSMAAAQ